MSDPCPAGGLRVPVKFVGTQIALHVGKKEKFFNKKPTNEGRRYGYQNY